MPSHSETSDDGEDLAMQRELDLENLFIGVALDTSGSHMVGISPVEFLDEFLPWNDDTPQQYRNQRPSDASLVLMRSIPPQDGETEHDMGARFRQSLQDWPTVATTDAPLNAITTGFGDFRAIDPNRPESIVDIAHYAVKDIPGHGASAYHLMQSQVMLKDNKSDDPFMPLSTPKMFADALTNEGHEDGEEAEMEQDSTQVATPDEGNYSAAGHEVPISYPAENPASEATKTRGYISAYAAMTMSVMFRGHLFTVILFGAFARFIRWDRRGSIVTRRFNYTKRPELIFDFYHRFAQLTPAQRGLDPSVTPISDDDPRAHRARAKFSLYDKDMLHCHAITKRQDFWPVSETLFEMTISFEGKTRQFIVPAPKFQLGSFHPFSRSTRRSLAYDPSYDEEDAVDDNEREAYGGILFMKDYWREPCGKLTRPEADIYKLLAEHDIPYVAEMEAGGDIPGMRTRTQETRFLAVSHPPPDGHKHRKRPLRCHRLFLRTVARDLSTFGNCRTLVNCVADAMEAAQEAFDRAHILHRDISAGNIMIAPGHRGVLVDWDRCIVLDLNDDAPYGSSGTWPFVSVHLVDAQCARENGQNNKETFAPHSLIDDRESAFWVLLFIAMLYLPHNLRRPRQLFYQMDQWLNYGYGFHSSSLGKRNCLSEWAEHQRVVEFAIPGLNELLRELARVFIVRYDYTPPREMDKKMYYTMLDTPNAAKFIHELPYGKYLYGKERMECRTWLYDTLRAHAKDISLPTQPANPSSPSDVVYDYRHNDCYSMEEVTRMEPKEERQRAKECRQERMTLSRERGLGAFYTTSSQGASSLALIRQEAGLGADLDPKDEPERKKRRIG
ncbi:hypothetical protein BDZ89DRAFT_993821 [Hymenopellis radicata]|nr:hypothetical protein BDZ89DRAFT_993821 [Hymenopellis radicata]